MTDQPSAGVTDSWSRLRGWLRGRLTPVFGAVWLIYLYYPWSAAWDAPAGAGRVISLCSIGLFAAVYLSALHALQLRRASGVGGFDQRAGWAFVAAELLLVVGASLAAHEVGWVGLVFVSVTAVFLLPTRSALLVVAVLAAAGEGVPALIPGWQAVNGIGIQCALAGMAIFGYTQILARSAELSAARQELADLAVGRERERMARDVHDILGHSLTVITVKADLAGKLLARADYERAAAEIAEVESLGRVALADVRATVSGLRHVGLASELAAARSALRAAGIRAEAPHATSDVPERLQELFAWTVREGTTNVIRHSGARRCEITMSADAVHVRDDGRGPAWSDSSPSGNGLVGLRERALEAGAHVAVTRVPTGGFDLSVVAGDAR
ncbi:MAG: sensor histidine kinase [Cellulomonas sp.]